MKQGLFYFSEVAVVVCSLCSDEVCQWCVVCDGVASKAGMWFNSIVGTDNFAPVHVHPVS